MSTAKRIFNIILSWIIKFKLELIIIAAAIAADQISKAIIAATIEVNDSVTLIPKFLNFTYVLNDGAAFGLLSGQTWFFILMPSIAAIVFGGFLFYKKNNSKLFVIGLALILAGTAGNLLDRIFNHGMVHDFIEFEFFGLTIFGHTTFAIFNIADSCLTIGVIIFSIYFIFYYKPEPAKTTANGAQENLTGNKTAEILETNQKDDPAETLAENPEDDPAETPEKNLVEKQEENTDKPDGFLTGNNKDSKRIQKEKKDNAVDSVKESDIKKITKERNAAVFADGFEDVNKPVDNKTITKKQQSARGDK